MSALLLSGFAAGPAMGVSLIAEGVLQSKLPEALWRELVSKLGYTVGFAEISRHSLLWPFWTTVLKGVFANWLIAPMVWLLPAAESARLWIIVVITSIVGIGAFAHIVAGSVDTFDLVLAGEAGYRDCLASFVVPTLIGNVLGGVTLVACLNYGQVAREIDR